jgi:acetyltransferase
MLVRFTQIDYHNEMALVAIYQGSDGEEEIGVARYMTNPDKKTCEFAIVVSDKWQGKGIARLLMQKLIEIARNRGLEIMEGQVLANNFRMLELMLSLNFQINKDSEDSGIKLVVTRLG